MTEKPAHVTGAVSGWRDGKSYYDAHCSCGWIVFLPKFDDCLAAAADHLHEHGLLTFEEQMAKDDKVRPFPNGTSYQIWADANCDRCRKGYDAAPSGWKCPIEKAIGEAMFAPHGVMDREMAVRGGIAEYPLRDCPEREIDYAAGRDA